MEAAYAVVFGVSLCGCGGRGVGHAAAPVNVAAATRQAGPFSGHCRKRRYASLREGGGRTKKRRPSGETTRAPYPLAAAPRRERVPRDGTPGARIDVWVARP